MRIQTLEAHELDPQTLKRATDKEVVRYGSHPIPFDVARSARSTLAIHVHPSGRVEVRAPEDASLEAIRAVVHRRRRWIVKQRCRFAEMLQAESEKQYVSGETHRYLGRQYRLKVMRTWDEASTRTQDVPPTERVRLVGRYFEIHTEHPDDPTHVRSLLEGWYRARAEAVLRERFERGCALMARYGVSPPPLQIRKMERRWGSCTASGRVLLNPRLILAPTTCIDYVVVHELCHLKHPHHGRDFYELLERILPEWKVTKEQLEKAYR